MRPIWPDGQITSDLRKPVSSPKIKNISLLQKCEQCYIYRHPVPVRGACHDRSRTWDGWRWTLVVPIANGTKAYGKDVWSRRRGAGVKSAVRPADDGGKRAVHRGEL